MLNTKRIILVLVIFTFMIGCTMKAPILLYKDSSERNPGMLPLRAGLVVENTQVLQGINVKSKQGALLPLIPLYFLTLKAEFPKGKEAEFMADMIRQYYVDSGIFEYNYQYPYKKSDVDIIVKTRLNKFSVKNSKSWDYLYNSVLSFVVPFGQFFLPQAKFYADYDITVSILLPNGKLIKEFNASKNGKDSVSMFGQPYGEYMFYKSIFKKIFINTMDSIKEGILIDRDKIIQAYKEFLTQ